MKGGTQENSFVNTIEVGSTYVQYSYYSSYQRKILGRVYEQFPNCQFFLLRLYAENLPKNTTFTQPGKLYYWKHDDTLSILIHHTEVWH